jgi:probable HAF family extracellular repeat protein
MRSIAHLALGLALAAAVVNGNSAAFAQGKKPPLTTSKYTLTDLLGFPDADYYQSQGQFITNRNAAGESLILGISYTGMSGATPNHQSPALWNIGADGSFPANNPIDLGIPALSRELEPAGLNQYGISVGRNRWANTQDENGEWILPSYVHVPGLPVPYQELPGSANRNTIPSGINDAGMIIGTLEVATDDPRYPLGIKGEGAVWQLTLDLTVSQPIRLGDFYPVDINNYGVMAGTMRDYAYPVIGWFEGTTLILVRMAPEPRFFGADVEALNGYPPGDARLAVVGNSYRNEAGQYDAEDSDRGVVWRPYNAARPTTVLGTLGGSYSTALDVNRAEQIVGCSSGKRGGQFAFVYANGTMTNLNAITAIGDKNLQYAFAINDDGDITGFMQIPRPVSEQHGFLLRPITP